MDFANGSDNAGVLIGLNEEHVGWKAEWTVEKWFDSDDYRRGFPSDETVELEGNMLVTAGITALLTLLIGGGGTAFNNSNSYLGVGSSATAAGASQTDLLAASDKLRKGMDSTFPSVAGAVVTFQSTFTEHEAIFAWNECGAFNAAAAGTMLNRKIVTLGSKSDGATWTLRLAITITSS